MATSRRKKPGSPSPEVMEALENQNVVEVNPDTGKPINTSNPFAQPQETELPRIEVPDVPVSSGSGSGSSVITAPQGFTPLPGMPSDFSYSLNDHWNGIPDQQSLESIGVGIPETSEAAFESKMAKLKGQRRTVQLNMERYDLQKDLYKLEGKRVGSDIERVNTLAVVQRHNQAVLKLVSERVKTAIAGVGLATDLKNLEGAMQEAALNAASVDLRIEGLQSDFDEARRVLDAKKQALLDGSSR